MGRTFSLAATVLAVALLAGCAGGPTGGDGFVTPQQDDDGRYVIELTGQNRFEPRHAVVPVGATVVWVVNGGAHTVTANDGSFDSGQLTQGDEFEQTFDQAGEHVYHCHPHEQAGMTGTLRIE
jgi:plastocyanin